ncbi:hypothetical protein V5799_009695 [Amblyomma americanum]|uniref:RING-type domain-containing protein n=2 Tax=Amblyomma americanum TaxID=6943 RepID=A0AAQ4FA49_AMBAM
MAIATDSKKHLLKGFRDHLDGRFTQFLDELPSGVPACSLCSVVPSEHYTLSCKHVYCSPCFLDTVRRNATNLWCPLDGKNFRMRKAPSPTSTDVDLLSGLPVHCWNKDNGCTFTGELERMMTHYRDCTFYKVCCGLCSCTYIRSDLAHHVKTAHAKSTKARASNKLKKHEVAAVYSGKTSVPDEQGVVAGEFVEPMEEYGAKQPSPQALLVSDGHLQEIVRAVAFRTASEAAEDVAQWNEALFRSILGGINQINERLDNLAETVHITYPREPPPIITLGTPPVRPLKQELQTEYAWTVTPYSKLRVGIHYVESLPFKIAPGHKVQLTLCTDGITLLELSVSVKIHRGDDDSRRELPWTFLRTCRFTLFDKSGKAADVTSLFSADDLFSRAVTTVDNLVSGWLIISKMGRGIFERDYVKDDSFTIGFSTETTPE